MLADFVVYAINCDVSVRGHSGASALTGNEVICCHGGAHIMAVQAIIDIRKSLNLAVAGAVIVQSVADIGNTAVIQYESGAVNLIEADLLYPEDMAEVEVGRLGMGIFIGKDINQSGVDSSFCLSDRKASIFSLSS